MTILTFDGLIDAMREAPVRPDLIEAFCRHVLFDEGQALDDVVQVLVHAIIVQITIQYCKVSAGQNVRASLRKDRFPHDQT